MFTFYFRSNSKTVNRKMSNLVGSQMPFAIQRSLNETAKTLHKKNQQDMKLAFDRPNRFTLNAYFIKYAKKYDTSVTIRRKDTHARKHYLEVQDEGGPRPRKGIENRFKYGVPTGAPLEYLAPTVHTPRSKAGNVTMGFYNKVFAQVNGKPSGKAKGRQYFVPRVTHPLGQGKRAGIYERTPAGNARKVFSFLSFPPMYRKRTNFHGNMTRYGKMIYPKKFKAAMRHALATARLR